MEFTAGTSTWQGAASALHSPDKERRNRFWSVSSFKVQQSTENVLGRRAGQCDVLSYSPERSASAFEGRRINCKHWFFFRKFTHQWIQRQTRKSISQTSKEKPLFFCPPDCHSGAHILQKWSNEQAESWKIRKVGKSNDTQHFIVMAGRESEILPAFVYAKLNWETSIMPAYFKWYYFAHISSSLCLARVNVESPDSFLMRIRNKQTTIAAHDVSPKKTHSSVKGKQPLTELEFCPQCLPKA